MASNHSRGGSAPDGEEKEGSSGASVSKLSVIVEKHQSMTTDAPSCNDGAPSRISMKSSGLTANDAQTRMLESNTKREKGTIALQKEAEAGDTTSHNKVSTHIPKHRLRPIATKPKHRLISTTITTTTKPKQQSSPSSHRQLPLGWTSKQESPPDHEDKKRTSSSSTSPSIMQMHALQKKSTELKLLPDKEKLKSFQRRKSSLVTSQQHQSKATASVPKRNVQITAPSQKQKQSEKRNVPPPKEVSTTFALPTTHRQQKSLAEQRRRVARNQTP